MPEQWKLRSTLCKQQLYVPLHAWLHWKALRNRQALYLNNAMVYEISLPTFQQFG